MKNITQQQAIKLMDSMGISAMDPNTEYLCNVVYSKWYQEAVNYCMESVHTEAGLTSKLVSEIYILDKYREILEEISSGLDVFDNPDDYIPKEVWEYMFHEDITLKELYEGWCNTDTDFFDAAFFVEYTKTLIRENPEPFYTTAFYAERFNSWFHASIFGAPNKKASTDQLLHDAYDAWIRDAKDPDAESAFIQYFLNILETVGRKVGVWYYAGNAKAGQDDRTYTVTEFCSNCETEIEMRWNTDTMGFHAFCPVCGQRLMLCDECQHQEGAAPCNYCKETDSCRYNPPVSHADDLDNELEYINRFVDESQYDIQTNDAAQQQLRSLWTAYCFHNNLDCDTAVYDRNLQALWQEMGEMEDTDNNAWTDFDSFDLYMGQWLS